MVALLTPTQRIFFEDPDSFGTSPQETPTQGNAFSNMFGETPSVSEPKEEPMDEEPKEESDEVPEVIPY